MTNSRKLKFLQKLYQQGYMTKEQLERAQQDLVYSKQNEDTNKILLIFSLLGVLFIGAGILSLFAYNWVIFPKFIKTILSIIPLLIVQGLLYWKLQTKGSKVWIQSLSLALGLSFTAALALIYQTYQLTYSIQSMFLLTLVVMIPAIYLLDGYYLALFCVLSLVMTIDLTMNYYTLLTLAIIPYYIKKLKSDESCNLLTLCYMYYGLHLSAQLVHYSVLSYVLIMIAILYTTLPYHRYFRKLSKIILYFILFIIASIGTEAILFLTASSELDLKNMGTISSLVFLVILSMFTYYRQFLLYQHQEHYVDILDTIIISLIGIMTTALFILMPTLLPFISFFILLGLCTAKIVLNIKEAHIPATRRYLFVLCSFLLFKILFNDIDLIVKSICFIMIGSGFIVSNFYITKRIRRGTI